MRAMAFAWRSLVRQPARATLGILGVAAVGALLFDMLMLSDGLVVSMRDLLERTGFDVRVTTSGDLRRGGERIGRASATVTSLAALPSVGPVLAIRFVDADTGRGAAPAGAPASAPAAEGGSEPAPAAPGAVPLTVQGVTGGPPWPWTILRGRDPGNARDVVINESLAEALGMAVGADLDLRARCVSRSEVLPAVRLRVAGVAAFPFETPGEHTAAGTMRMLDGACGGNGLDEADVILAGATGDANAAAAAIRLAQPTLSVATNEQVVGRLQRNGFTYFRQISTVLTTVTLSFALLLITVLLTVSVNQRLGEIAALRALGFSRGRVVADVLCESVLIVGLGGGLSLPLGVALAQGLDRILTAMPGIPGDMHFFVFEPQTLVAHVALLAVTALAAALYPMRIVAGLPIAATLRNEVVS